MKKRTLAAGNAVLVAHHADGLGDHAEWLLHAVKSFDGRGKGLVDGATIQIGWAVLSLRQRGSELWICEPNFSKDPLKDIRPDVTVTLMVLGQQREVMARLGEGLDFLAVRFDEMILIAKGCLAEPRLYLHHRWEKEGTDSGWYIGVVDQELENTPDNFEKIFAYQLLQSRPELLQVLILPREYIAYFDGERLEGISDENDEEVWNLGA